MLLPSTKSEYTQDPQKGFFPGHAWFTLSLCCGYTAMQCTVLVTRGWLGTSRDKRELLTTCGCFRQTDIKLGLIYIIAKLLEVYYLENW